MKRILITGFSGFVSYYFLDYLNSTVAAREENEEIEILGIDLQLPDNYAGDYHFEHIKIRFLALHLLDFSALKIAITSFAPHYILHLASLS
ncbi:MAG: hypothetical protein J6Y13_11080, partial [Treponema sp.]|nr:hypothetical protein [Treponema sp.]